MSSAGGLLALNYNVSYIIQPNPLNYKINRNFNSNRSNISYKMYLSKILKLDSNSQQINRIGRLSGRTQYGNFYLGQPLNINYLGRTEGMPGGSGKAPTNF